MFQRGQPEGQEKNEKELFKMVKCRECTEWCEEFKMCGCEYEGAFSLDCRSGELVPFLEAVAERGSSFGVGLAVCECFERVRPLNPFLTPERG